MFARGRKKTSSGNLGGLVDYGGGAVPESTHRPIDGKVRKKVALLNRKKAESGAINLEADIGPKKSGPSRSANPICSKPSLSCRNSGSTQSPAQGHETAQYHRTKQSDTSAKLNSGRRFTPAQTCD